MKNPALILIFALSLGLLACNGDDHDEHEVVIEFLEPMDDEVVSSADEVHIHIRITSEDEIHAANIELYPESDEDDLIINHNAHSHENSYEFEEDYNLSTYPSGTEFHLLVRAAKDHESTEFESATIHFSIP